MKRLLMVSGMTALLLSGCGVAEDPAAVITDKPDQARNAALLSAVQTAVAEVESTRTADKIIISNPKVPGFKTKIQPHGLGANYCLVVTDEATGAAKAYTSADSKTIDGSTCPEAKY